MAVIQNNKKFRVYQSLCHINRAMDAVVFHCRALEETGLFTAFKMRVFRGLTRELQSQISHDITDKMHSIEDEDWRIHGKTRIAWEHHLDPDKASLTKPRMYPSRAAHYL